MTTVPEATDRTAVDLAREGLYRFLAVALSDPRQERFELVLDPCYRPWLLEAVALLRDEAAAAPEARGFGELPAEELRLEELAAEIDRGRDYLIAEYDRIFGLTIARECPPYETEYFSSSEPFFRSQQMADVAGFYRAFGLETPHTRPERPDHVAMELEFMAILLLKRRLAAAAVGQTAGAADEVFVCEEAERAFFRDHLAWWLPAFATGLRRRAEHGFYAALSRALAALLPLERRRAGVAPPRLPLTPSLPETAEEPSGCLACPTPC